ncbi:MAG: T9SS type A sorting domain-containing protein, partial [Ferruginibacter sp.]
AYSCVIGTNSLLGGDGVVQTPQANLKNYYPSLAVDTFLSKAPAFTIIWHTEVQKQTATVLKAMDEPYNSTAYGVDFDENYFGNFTPQSIGASSSADVDDYQFTAPADGILKLNLFDLPIPNVHLDVYDNSSLNVYTAATASKSDTTFTFPVNTGNYMFSLTGTTDATTWLSPYAMKLSFTPNVVLPLTLFEFTATQGASQVKLTWSTANEINTSSFIIEHSTNGNEWLIIGDIVSLNSNAAKYNFLDQKPINGTNYYRLKMVDKNGTFSYSDVKVINISVGQNMFTLAPNPAVNNSNIIFANPVNVALITIVDAQGRKLFIKNYKGTSISNYTLPTENLPAGIYFVTVSTANDNTTQRLIVIK